MRACRALTLYALFLLLLWPAQSEGSTILTITCDPPKGHRYDYGLFGKLKFQEDEDGISGVQPKFVIDGETKNKMLVLFGDALHSLVGTTAEAKEAVIIQRSSEQIVAVERMPLEVWMYSFFPDRGIAYFTRHSRLGVGGSVHATTMKTKCIFSNN